MSSNNTDLEKRLWDAADELRANSKLKSSEYSVPVLGLIFLASLAEFVGGFWFRKTAEVVIQGDFNRFGSAKAVRFSHGQFDFAV